jgi:hypothetical protein
LRPTYRMPHAFDQSENVIVLADFSRILSSDLQESDRQVDCCRHSLFFPDVASLIVGLRAIEADTEVEIMHVKNRLSPSHDVRITAGYRDVLVNLRLRTEEARRLNVDHHVWELQLILISFARIKVRSASVSRDVSTQAKRAATV